MASFDGPKFKMTDGSYVQTKAIDVRSSTDISPYLSLLSEDSILNGNRAVVFDVYWDVGTKKSEWSLSLVKLSTRNLCLLLRLPKPFHDNLKDLYRFFASKFVTFVGVQIEEDLNLLRENHGLVIRNVIELGKLAAKAQGTLVLEFLGTRELAYRVLWSDMSRLDSIEAKWEEKGEEEHLEAAAIEGWLIFSVWNQLSHTHETARFIVYELMPNVSLESHLHGSSRGSAITWPMRMKIALDVTRGLEYLHEHCRPAIIHRDLKSSNILLDSNFNAKISDFGLAVVGGSKNKNLKLSGTVGYVAPEYLLDGVLTEKSDVYAFGVVLLELLLGKKPVEKLAPGECQSIITWAMPYLTDRTKLPNVIDPAIKDTMDLKHLYQVAAVAVLCVQPEPSYRPLITDVLHSLIPLVPMELGGTLKTIKSASMDHF